MIITDEIKILREKNIFSDLDVHFARFISKMAGTDDDPYVLLAAAMVSSYRQEGHICLDLMSLDGKLIDDNIDDNDISESPPDGLRINAAQWIESLKKCAAVGKPGEYKPLILDSSDRVYLHRFWEYQRTLADNIRLRVKDRSDEIDMALLGAGLSRLFPSDNVNSNNNAKGNNEADWQKIAAFSALTRRFCVISGGPGTGKTTTVAKILALMLEQNSENLPKLALAAPTGKAAARLQEAITAAKQAEPGQPGFLDCAPHIRDMIPESASTIHRLLKAVPGSLKFRHNKENPLTADALIIDEASMIDIALMAHLLNALPDSTALVLLGDRDQLSSVEAGAILGDICDPDILDKFSKEFCDRFLQTAGQDMTHDPDICLAARDEQATCNSVVRLKKNFRFKGNIADLSVAVNQGDAEKAASMVIRENYPDIEWKDLSNPKTIFSMLRKSVIRNYKECIENMKNVSQVFERLDRFRILCALREGPCGANAINIVAEQILKDAGIVRGKNHWYPGRPVMVTRNDYSLGLFNGDVGITLPDAESGDDLRVFFPGTDFLSNNGKTYKKFHPLRLPEHESVFAMTVHKSQGSEFDHILLILPDKGNLPILTREMIYTGITRARKKVEIWAGEGVFAKSVMRQIKRGSGLRDALKGS